jgi:hypothetical protein
LESGTTSDVKDEGASSHTNGEGAEELDRGRAYMGLSCRHRQAREDAAPRLKLFQARLGPAPRSPWAPPKEDAASPGERGHRWSMWRVGKSAPARPGAWKRETIAVAFQMTVFPHCFAVASPLRGCVQEEGCARGEIGCEAEEP